MAVAVSAAAAVPCTGLLLLSSSAETRLRNDAGHSLCLSSSQAGSRVRYDPLSVGWKLGARWGNGNGNGVGRVCEPARRRWRTIESCDAAWGGGGQDFGSQAGRMAEGARRRASEAAQTVSNKAGELLNNAKRSAEDLKNKSDVQGRVNRAAQAASRRFDEFGYDMRRNAAKWDREYGISDKVQGAKEFAAEQMQNAERQLGVRQKARNFSADFRLKLPMYRRQLSNFLDTPVGRSFVTLFMVWLLFSGWFFRILLLSMWVLPLAAPLLLTTLTRAAVVQGTCPNCGQRYVGSRNQAVTCNRCRGMVWQPRQDFSKDGGKGNEPSIIDIEIDPQ